MAKDRQIQRESRKLYRAMTGKRPGPGDYTTATLAGRVFAYTARGRHVGTLEPGQWEDIAPGIAELNRRDCS